MTFLHYNRNVIIDAKWYPEITQKARSMLKSLATTVICPPFLLISALNFIAAIYLF